MREIIFYSRTAPTSGHYVKEDLQESGRLDIAIHTVIASFFLSNQIRKDVCLHLVFGGPPDPVKHLELKPLTRDETPDAITLNKKDVSQIIRRMLFKYREGEKREIFPGYFIEKKPLLKLVDELIKEDKTIFLLDPKGEDIRTVEIKGNPIFLLGDHKGLPAKELKRLKQLCTPVSIGKRVYFASQTVAILNNELDRREDSGLL
jgi:tRNA (pseudouridine54-N1)-methyltransferase